MTATFVDQVNCWHYSTEEGCPGCDDKTKRDMECDEREGVAEKE